MTKFATYANTEENAKHVGWAMFPEFCKGDLSAPWVTHDHIRGLYIFHGVFYVIDNEYHLVMKTDSEELAEEICESTLDGDGSIIEESETEWYWGTVSHGFWRVNKKDFPTFKQAMENFAEWTENYYS